MKSLVTTMMIVAMATPAYAQLTPGGAPGSGSSRGIETRHNGWRETKAKSEDDLQYERELDQAYKSGLSKIPDKKANADPWGNVRGAVTPQSRK